MANPSFGDDDRVRSDTGPFVIVPEWLLDLGLSPTDVAVYLQIARHADYASGEAWPSRSTIADLCDCSVDTVDRAVKRLVAAEALIVEKRTRRDGRNASNRYWIPRARPSRIAAAPLRPRGAAPSAKLGPRPCGPNETQPELETVEERKTRARARAQQDPDSNCVSCHGEGVVMSGAPGPDGEPFYMPCWCTVPIADQAAAAASEL